MNITTVKERAAAQNYSAIRAVLTFVSIVAAVLTLLFVGASVAYAADTTTDPAAPVTLPQLTPQNVSALLGALIPILVNILARSGASDQVKVWINIVLTAALGAVAALVVVNPATGVAEFGWVPFLTAWLYAFVTSTIAYLGALKHFDINALLLSVGGLFGQRTDPDDKVIEGEVVKDENPDQDTYNVGMDLPDASHVEPNPAVSGAGDAQDDGTVSTKPDGEDDE